MRYLSYLFFCPNILKFALILSSLDCHIDNPWHLSEIWIESWTLPKYESRAEYIPNMKRNQNISQSTNRPITPKPPVCFLDVEIMERRFNSNGFQRPTLGVHLTKGYVKKEPDCTGDIISQILSICDRIEGKRIYSFDRCLNCEIL